jgi:protein SCO1
MMKFQTPGDFSSLLARKWQVVTLLLLLLCCLPASQANGQTLPRSSKSDALSSRALGKLIEIDDTRVLLPDIKVFTHGGEQVSFYTDLIKDKVVLLSFFYTSCTYVCALQADHLSKVQALLGARLGKDVFLISISMDPDRDTPQKLKYWGRSVGARTGWTLVSSNTPEMNAMLKALTGYNPGPKDMHRSLVFIGNDKTDTWITTDGLLDPASLITLLDRVSNTTDRR